MNKTITGILIATIAIAVIMGAWFYLNQQNVITENYLLEENIDQPAQINTAKKKEAQKAAPATVADLMISGKTQKCTADYETGSDTIKQNGIFYIAQNKLRIDVASDISGQKTNIHTIVMDGWQYNWVEGDQTIKIEPTKVNIVELSTKAINAGINQADIMPILYQPLEFTCTPWTADETMFALPSGTEFKDNTAGTEKLIQEKINQTENIITKQRKTYRQTKKAI